jgi:uncharacterized RDD family membrane protein YckC
VFATDTEPIAATLAARSTRLLAFLIDQVIGAGALLLLKLVAVSIGGVLVWVVLMALNVVQIILVSTRGQSIGKMMMRIAIVDGIDKVPPGFVRAGLIRTIPLMVVSVVVPVLTLPYLVVDALPIFTSSRRCIHDHLAGTIVTKLPRENAMP